MVEFEKSIKECVQIITISNGCCLFSRQFLKKLIDPSFNLWELTRCPTKKVFISKNGNIQSKLGLKRKQKILYIQILKSIFINKSGHGYDWGRDFPPKLYLDFINAKKIPEFCIFPSDNEMKDLCDKYKKAGIKNLPEFAFAFEDKVPKEFIKEDEKIKNKIRKINNAFISKKRKEFKEFLQLYLDKKLSYHKINWLNKELENSSNTLINPGSFLWKKISKESQGDEINDSRNLEEVVGMKNTEKMFLVKSHRAFGHFAYCCLELFQDILNEKNLFCCQNCGQYNYAEKHSDRKFCNKKENLKCYKSRKAIYSKNYRKNKKC
jgi:hypothetical protein